MLFNYLLLAVRNITKQRGYAMVNTLGLAIGLASALFILLYVRDELTFDTMHPKANQTYRMGYSRNCQMEKRKRVHMHLPVGTTTSWRTTEVSKASQVIPPGYAGEYSI